MSKTLSDVTYDEIIEELKRRDKIDHSLRYYFHKHFGEYDEVKLREYIDSAFGRIEYIIEAVNIAVTDLKMAIEILEKENNQDAS